MRVGGASRQLSGQRRPRPGGSAGALSSTMNVKPSFDAVVPEHVAREGGGQLTRYATTEEDEATLRELLLRYVRHPSDSRLAFRLYSGFVASLTSLCVDVSFYIFTFGLASKYLVLQI